jgi:hypothetical protein
MVAAATEPAKVVVQQVRGHIAHRPARAHRVLSPFWFVELSKQPNEKLTLVAKCASHIDGRPELRHHHHDLHSPGPLCCQANDERSYASGSGTGRVAEWNTQRECQER